MAKDIDGGAIGGCLLALAQLATYVMAAIRWFSTNHDTFWFGFKELVWALWLAVPVIVFALLQTAIDFVVDLLGPYRPDP